ncbi:MAG: ATP-binding protein [Pseudomonadales bacterium]|nr:ATP-binding protein [Pseudomonadales bacterium]
MIKFKYPFTAIAGQRQFKLALILAAISPAVGGVLVSGPRGSAKSTLARGLADVMPEHDGQRHSFVTLPLGATEEMLVGSLDLQKIIAGQEVKFQPGLLAKADDGILYVDEVNLLADNLVDLLLDVASSGINVIERDGISHSHKAEFILLGTMNPDEGELRPQLQDRFGLSVELSNQYSIDERMQIVDLRQQFDGHPKEFLKKYQTQQQALSASIEQARVVLSEIDCDLKCRRMIAERCHEAGVDGLRADIVWCHAAIAHAALQLRKNVGEDDVLAVEELVLVHRRKQKSSSSNPPPNNSSEPPPFKRPEQNSQDSHDGDWGAMAPQQQNTAEQARVNLKKTKPKPQALLGLENSKIKAAKGKGQLAGGSHQGKAQGNKISWFKTLIGSAGQWPLKQLHYKKQHTGQPVLHLVLLDTSASTLKNQLFAKAKAVILQIADSAYLNREHLAIVGFGNQKVETLLSSRRAPKALRGLLDSIPAAGGTPLLQALSEAQRLQRNALSKTPGLQLKSYIITDGKTTQTVESASLLGEIAVIDIEQSAVKRGKAREIAKALDAEYYPLLA